MEINKLHIQKAIDKKELLRTQNHLTRPARLEGVVKEKMMQPVKKKKQG